MSLATIIQMKY